MRDPELVIPHVARNDELLIRNLPHIRRNLAPSRITIVAARNTLDGLADRIDDGLTFVDEDSLLPGLTLAVTRERLLGIGVPATRAGWYFQQFLKMAWALTAAAREWYLVWDSDTLPLRPVSFSDDEGRPVFLTTDQYKASYFETLRQLVGLGRAIPASFIAESMLVNRDVMLELIEAIAKPGCVAPERFYERILGSVAVSGDPLRAFSEFETYGTFALSRHPGMYSLRPSRGFRNAAKYYGLSPNRHDLAWLARRYDIVSFEGWNTMIAPFIAFNKAVAFLGGVFFSRAQG